MKQKKKQKRLSKKFMDWTEIKATVPSDKTDEAAAIANMTVPYGIYIEDYSNLEADALEIAHIDLIDEELVKKDRTHSVIHLYISKEENALEAIAFLKERMNAAGISFDINSETVDDTDWNENWKKYFKAFKVGNKLAVCPSWENADGFKDRSVISLDPGTAFGTGTHATTSLCMEALESIIKGGETVLDIGTGSGILSIAAVLLGAKSAEGVDIDELSVKTAINNAERNKVSDKCKFTVGDLADKISGKYDIICANIVADVIIRLFENVKEYMHENTKFIISGIIDIRACDIENAIEKFGFKIIKKMTRDEWHAFILTV